MGAVDRGEVRARVGAVAGSVGDAVLPGDDGGDALAQQGQLHLGVEHGRVGVGVGVDEAGHDETAARVEHLGAVGDGEVLADGSDAARPDEEVGAVRGLAVAGDETAAAEEERGAHVGARSSRGADRGRRGRDGDARDADDRWTRSCHPTGPRGEVTIRTPGGDRVRRTSPRAQRHRAAQRSGASLTRRKVGGAVDPVPPREDPRPRPPADLPEMTLP